MLDYLKLFDAYRQMIWTLIILNLPLNYAENKSSHSHVVVQGHSRLNSSESTKNVFFSALTRHAFELGTPNLHQMCI